MFELLSAKFSHVLPSHSLAGRWLVAVLWLGAFCCAGYAQNTFNSGSTGADGAFNPTTSVTVPLPESGVFNFTTVNIPQSVTVRFTKNSRNTPVTILATGNVTIAGTIDVSGSDGSRNLGGAGGPGGYNGGNSGIVTNNSNVYSTGTNGDGPGGGIGGSSANSNAVGGAGGGGFGNPGLSGTSTSLANNGAGGPRYGLPTLLPLLGGSGGGGEVSNPTAGYGGGGGGGAILIASSGSIIFSGSQTIDASGGQGSWTFSCSGATGSGSGGGSGGAIRLIANIISGSSVFLNATGASAACSGGRGGGGYIRVEAFDLTSFSPSTSSSNARISLTTPRQVTLPNLPSIRIASVAGIAPPANPNGSIQGGPDITLPMTQPNPVTVALSAANIPLGTTLQVILTPENGARTIVQSTALSGTVAASTATASINIPDGISVIQASGTVDVSSGNQPITVNGEKVTRIEINAVYGGASETYYVTASGKRIKIGE